MTRIEVRSHLRYDVHVPTSFGFAVLAAENPHQHVEQQDLVLEPEAEVQRVRFDPSGHDLVRVTVDPGTLSLTYHATVTLDPHVPDDVPRHETPFADLPGEVLGYLHPSRFCESDLLSRLAERSFGDLEPGFDRVTGICNWIFERLSYEPGSTGPTTTAVDVLVAAAGVCRDFAHLAIALCRALGIPARYVSGYAVDLDPPDFHGFFEAYLAGNWYLFDATRMAPVDGFVRIAAGRDAADVAFAAIVGSATMTQMEIVTRRADGTAPGAPRTTAAISTA